MMHGRGKSDFAIVAVKPANKAEHPAEQSAVEVTAAEPVERRAETKGNASQQSTCRTQSRESVSQALARIRQAFAVVTRGKSRMRESCTYGSAREEVIRVPTATVASGCWRTKTWLCAKGDSGRSVMTNKDIIIGRVINITGMIGVLAGTVLFTFAIVLILFRRGFGLDIPNSIHWFW